MSSRASLFVNGNVNDVRVNGRETWKLAFLWAPCWEKYP